ncbi:MAG: MFS transporter [Acidimicrobiia bacterium]
MKRSATPGLEPSRRSTGSWVLFDLANTILALGVLGLYFPAWLVSVQGEPDSSVTDTLPSEVSDLRLAVTISVAMLAAIVLGPWIGARSDFAGRRIPYLISTTVLAVGATFFLATFGVLPSLVFLVVGLIGFNLGSVVYDALLPDVSTPGNRGLVSGLGVGVGYLGSAIALIAGVLVVDRLGYAAYFRTVALLFLLFALPALFFIQERPRPPRPGAPAFRAVMAHLVRSWRRTRAFPGVTRFLIGRFFYTDAINTLIAGFLTLFLLNELGFQLEEVQQLLAIAIGASIIGGLGSGRLVDYYGPRRVLHLALYVWIAAISVGIVAATIDAPGLGWLLGPVGGLALGATWASDRVYMARISPPKHLGEFYGLYATVGRFATWLGPLLWLIIVVALGLGRSFAMAALVVLIAVARVVLRGVDDRPREQADTQIDAVNYA